MEREPEPRVHMRMEGPDSSPVYLLFNDFWGPVEVELSLVDQVNVMAEPALPARFVVPGQTEKLLVGIGALDPARGFQYRLQLASVPGKPLPDLVQGLVIDPPFPAGSSFYVSQGFNGTETHNTPDSIYAIDIVMPIGTTVVAARDGVIMDVEEDFNRSGSDLQEFADKANHVRILHDDGTMALYAHLDLASVEVRAGGGSALANPSPVRVIPGSAPARTCILSSSRMLACRCSPCLFACISLRAASPSLMAPSSSAEPCPAIEANEPGRPALFC